MEYIYISFFYKVCIVLYFFHSECSYLHLNALPKNVNLFSDTAV